MKKRLLICIVLFSNIFLSYAQIYVSTDGSNDNDGLSWNTPLADIRTAIERSTSGDEIWVKNGTYKPDDTDRSISFTLKSGVKLFGSFNGTEQSLEERERVDTDADGIIEDWEFKHPTVLSGDINAVGDKIDNSRQLVIIPIDGSAETSIDGFIIEDGYNDNEMSFASANSHYLASGIVAGGGIIENCIIRNCKNVKGLISNDVYYGGGIYTSDATKITACLISNCSIDGEYSVRGGGACLNNSTLENSKVTNCHVNGESTLIGGGVFAANSLITNTVVDECYTNNVGKSQGGGIYSQGSIIISSTIRSCTSGGTRASGGGVFSIDSSVSQSKIYNCSSDNEGGGSYSISSSYFNCLIFNNTANLYGGGLFAFQSDIVNSNIVNNNCVEASAAAGGLYSDDSSVYNTVIWGNRLIESGSTPQLFESSGSDVDYCAIEGQDYGKSNIELSSNNTGTEDVFYPRFLNPTAFNGKSSTDEESTGLCSANWDIEKTSSLIEKGDNGKLTENSIGSGVDLNGNGSILDDISDFKDLNDDARLFNVKVDIGAYESIFIDVVLPSIPTIQYGTSLGEIALSGGSAIDNRTGTPLEGEFVFASASIIPPITDPATQYRLIFRATDNVAYPDKFEELQVNVTSKVLNIENITVENKIYDGTPDAIILTQGNLAGIVGADNVILEIVSLEAMFDSKHVGDDKIVSLDGYSLSGDDMDNYTLGTVTSTANILQKNISVSSLSAQNKQYDKSTTAQYAETPTLIGTVINDYVSLIVGSANFEDAQIGDNKLVKFTDFTLDGTDAGNYKLSQSPDSYADITPVELKIEGLNFSNKVYDGNTSATGEGTPTLNGIIEGDEVTLDDGSFEAFFTDANVGENKAITINNISISGTDKDNYTLSNPGAFNANITAAELTVAGLGVADKIYDKTNSAALTGNASLQGILNNDDVRLSNDNPTVSFVDANAEDQKETNLEMLSLSGTKSSNYTLIQPVLTASISQIEIEIKADNKTITYGEALPDLSYILVSGTPLSGHDFIGELGVSSILDAGEHDILQNSLKVDDGNDGLNYKITFNEGVLTVNQADNSIQFDMDSSTSFEEDKTIELSATSTSGEAISFSSSDNNILSIDNGIITIHSYGTVTIVASEAGNVNYKAAESVSVLFTVKLDVPIVSKGSNMLLIDNIQEQFAAYQWYKNGEKIMNAQKQYYHSAEGLSGEYYCMVTTSKGDVFISNTISHSATKSARVYPSPAHAGEIINIELSADKPYESEPTLISIYNISGKLVKQISNARVKETFHLDKNGIYIIKTQGGSTSTQKIIVR